MGAEAPVWQGAKSEHTRRYVSDEQRSQTGWIGIRKCEAILEQALSGMALITAKQVSELREKSGAGMMDCKKALAEADGDFSKALVVLRKKGLADAAKRSMRVTRDGLIASYIHVGGKVGTLLELNCETDFVARTQEFQDLAKELALQIVGAAPRWVSREDVPCELMDKEREIYREQAQKAGKPERAIEKIVDGKLNKFYSQNCLLEQACIRDPSGKSTVKSLVQAAVAKLGENITVRRFARFQLGE